MLQQNFYPGKVIQIWDASVGGTSSRNDADIPNPSYLVEELTGTTTGPSANVFSLHNLLLLLSMRLHQGNQQGF